MDRERAARQLRVIDEVVVLAAELGADVWLRGGWAMDFVLGRPTRDHADIDWFAWARDAPKLTAALSFSGYETVAGPPPEQQLDVTKHGEELSFAWLATDSRGRIVVAGGPWAGQPWPDGMLDGPSGQIGRTRCSVISVAAQIEIKEMLPVWDPRRARRAKDVEDIAHLRAIGRVSSDE